jgi:WD40 repeat protein
MDGLERGVQPFDSRQTGGFGEVGESIPHSWEISKAILLKDRNRVLVAGGTNDAVVWDVNRAHPARQRRVLREQLIAVGFTADSREVRLFTKKGVCRFMSVMKTLPATNHVVVPFGVETAAFAPGAKQVAIASGTNGWIWEVEPARQLAVLPPGVGAITHFAFSPDGQTLAMAGDDASLLLWDVTRGVVRGERLDLKPSSTAKSAGSRLQSIEFTADSRWLAVAGDSGLVHVMEVGTGKILAILEHGAAVSRALVLPGGARVATACHSGEARIWDIATARPVGRPMPHAGMILDLDVSPDGRRVATAGDDRAIRVWDLERGTRVSEFTTTRSFLRTRFIGNGRGLISSTKEDGVVLLHDPDTGQSLTRRRDFGVPSNRFVVSPNGDWIAMYQHGRDGVLTSVMMPSTPAPPWVLDLAESIAGERILADDTVETLMPSEYLRLRARLSGLKGDDYWHRVLLPGLMEGVLGEGEEP